MVGNITTQSYLLLAVFQDTVSAIILFIIFLTMLGLPRLEENVKLRREMNCCLVFGMAACLIDILAFTYMGGATGFGIYCMLTELSFAFSIIFMMLSSGVVLQYLILNGKVNYTICRTARILYLISIAAMLIPPVFEKIIVISPDYELGFGPLIRPLIVCAVTAGLLVIYEILANSRAMGAKFTLLFLLFRLMPIVIYFVIWDSQTSLMLPYALFLMIAYIFVFQQLMYKWMDSRQKLFEHKMELADLKTKSMLSQVKPHFVYNTLSSIARLCSKDPQKAKELTLDFSDYLRNNLDTLEASERSVCIFETELEHINTYLRIEKVRFGERLKVEYDIKERDFTVPALSIQPLVENAVKHGICVKKTGGTVKISSEKLSGGYLITIKDDGVGFDVNAAPNDGREHIGIINVRKRIELFHGRMDIKSSPGCGTEINVFVNDTED